MITNDAIVVCANCANTVVERDAEHSGWRYWSDGLDVHAFCPRARSESSRPPRQPA